METHPKPVCDYIVNGPIPASDLAYLDVWNPYLEMGIIDTILDIHFMLERICTQGSPKWWKGSLEEFEHEFQNQYQNRLRGLNKNDDVVWSVARSEVREGRLLPLPEDETDEQLENYLSHGLKLLHQTYAVELLLDMWVEAAGV